MSPGVGGQNILVAGLVNGLMLEQTILPAAWSPSQKVKVSILGPRSWAIAPRVALSPTISCPRKRHLPPYTVSPIRKVVPALIGIA